ncbi:MAG: glycerol kinase [Deltaproteobacteria bacterium CG_4_9_14_3_um_filter_63_12]|nr:MAG: glycerol kinase [Deltaproteobacteria bacterium CG17_big_fil_post_rev_8_21_14_2_50_63_7]PJB33254.1 MAG: glycerol kinase [Deltaproteobacteria bacterium CG_4_9_14_3_um_filter_63_12]
MRYLLAIDQGTTGTTAIVLDEELNTQASVNREFAQLYPQPGWVEHDPNAIWTSVVEAMAGALRVSEINPNDIAGIGITNQRETTFVWDRESGEPIHNAIVWQCRRTTERCDALRAAGHEAFIKEKTGLVLDPYFSGTKLGWILDHTSTRSEAVAGKLAFGTCDTYLLWRLTAGAVHATDVSNASRTMLMDLQTLSWDPELLALLNIPRALLPEIRGNAEVYGHTKGVPGLPDGIPIAGMAGDQQAALFGQVCFRPGEAKCTFGTGSFLLMNTGSQVVRSENGLLTTVGWRLGDQTTYVLEGSTFIAGAVVQWLRDGLEFFSSAHEIEALAEGVPDSGGVVLVPSLTGLGAPHWNPSARGVIWGLTRGTTRGHIARAALEGIAHQNTDLLEAMATDLGKELASLKVDGGAAANDLLMQIQADLLGCSLVRPAMLQTTALGAALLAGLGVGLFADTDAVLATWKMDRRFEARGDAGSRAAMRALWHEGLKRV